MCQGQFCGGRVISAYEYGNFLSPVQNHVGSMSSGNTLLLNSIAI